jgi:flavin-dependent dehydrogenase
MSAVSAPLPAHADAVVLGGGPAGVAAALVLAGAGAAVLVLERSRYHQPRVGETFPPAVRLPLARLGLEGELPAADHLPSYGVRAVWGGSEPYERSFVLEPYGNGWHVDRRGFDAALAAAAEARGVRVERGARLAGAAREGDGGWTLGVAAGGRTAAVRARVVVDATGRASSFARAAGARRRSADALVGVVGVLTGGGPDADAEGFTLLEAVEHGWWYSAPLPGERLVAAFMTDADLRTRLSAGEAQRWSELLRGAPHTARRAARFGVAGAPRVVSANSSRVVPACGPGWLAAGDAAAAQDPLSGDGVCRALESGVRAARAVLAEWQGDEQARPAYAAGVKEEFGSYLRRRDAYYTRETRWAASPFWARRKKPA